MSLALKLKERGFYVVPLYGTGAPAVSYKKDVVHSDNEMERWGRDFPDASYALRCGYTDLVALDVDVDNEKFASALRSWLNKNTEGKLLYRTREETCRFAVIFRAGLDALTNGHSAKFTSPKHEKPQEIEYQAYNQLITVIGEHRKTGAKYTMRPKGVHAEDLAVIDRETIERFFAVFEHNAKKLRWTEVGARRFSSDAAEELDIPEEGVAETMDTPRKGPNMSESQIDAILKRANGDYRENWLDVGMALHLHYGGSKAGLEKWDAWSSKFQGYEGLEDCAVAWDSFRVNVAKPVTMATISYRNPKQEEFEEDDGVAKHDIADQPKTAEKLYDRFLKQHVLIEDGSWVGVLSASHEESLLGLQDTRNKYAHLGVFVETGTLNADGDPKTKKVPMVTHWLQDAEKKRCYSFTYAPGQPRLHRPEGLRRKYWNRYVPTKIKRRVRGEENTECVERFLSHIRLLFPDETDNAWVLDWVAQMVQAPEDRPTTHILHISPFHGTGRGWLVELLVKLVGVTNHKVTNISNLADEKGFSGFLDESVLVTIEETLERGQGRYGVGNRMRDVLASKRQYINRKYGMDGTCAVYSRFFMMSNHIDALVLNERDRRVAVFMTLTKPSHKGYYTELYKLLEDAEFLDSVYTFLMDRKYDPEVRNHVPHNASRKELIRACRSTTSQLLHEFLVIVDGNWYSREQFETWADTKLEGVGEALNHKELAHLYRETSVVNRNGLMASEYKMMDEEPNTKVSERLLLCMPHQTNSIT